MDDNPPAPSPRPGTLAVLGWAAFLAASWTWVIGMFLPVLLVRDYGPWGFVAFALPNIIGAAAMGWTITSPAESAALVTTHRAACRAFSLVTIAFHAFVLTWLYPLMIPSDYPSAGIPYLFVMVATVITIVVLFARGIRHTTIAAAALAMSAALAAMLAASGVADDWSAPLLTEPLSSVQDLMLLAPVMVFGFALCPYLDLTFHRARRNLDRRGSKLAFGIGFGVFFAAMILITLLYAPTMRGAIGTGGAIMMTWIPAVGIFCHLTLQSIFTVVVHSGAATAPPIGRRHATPVVAALLVGAAAGIASYFAPTHANLSAGEVLYRSFMAFYGLLFPAYVWLIMIPTKDGHGRPTRAKLRVLALAVGIAVPMFYMGFIQRRELFLAPGLLTLLLARLALPKSESLTTSAAAPSSRRG